MLIIPFQIDDQTFAIDARAIQRVLPYCEPRRPLSERRPVLGTIPYGPSDVPIFDLVEHLVQRPHRALRSTRSLLVEIPYRGGWHNLLLLAEGVTSARKVDQPESEPRDDGPCPERAYLGPQLYHDGWLIQMIEVDQLIEEPQFDDLFAVADSGGTHA